MGDWAYISGIFEIHSRPNDLENIKKIIPPIVSHKWDGTMNIFAHADQEHHGGVYYVAIFTHEETTGDICDERFNSWISKISYNYPISSLMVRVRDNLGFDKIYDDHTSLSDNYFEHLGDD